MATNKKITELTELSEADLSDDDVLPIVDISAGTTNKVRKSTLASALSGVASITATSPISVNQSTGSVVVSTGTIPITSGGTGETTASAALAALGGISDPTTTRGDIITKGASTLDRLPIGAVNTFLKSDGTDPTWAALSVDLTSDVTGTLPLANGGTNSTTASGARTSIGAAASGAKTDITSLAADIVISGSTSGDALRISQTGAGNALLVEDSANPDSTPFVVDASGKVGVGSTPAGAVKLTVTTSDSGVTPNTTGDDAFVESSGNTGITIGSGTASQGRIYFGDSDNAIAGRVGYDHTNDSLYFGTNGVNQRLVVESGGTVKVVVAAYNPITTDNDLSFDQTASNNFKCTPSGSGTLTFTNHTDGQSGNILLDNSGGHAISLAATTKGDANLATTISTAGTYWLSYYDDGTNAYVVTSAVFA